MATAEVNLEWPDILVIVLYFVIVLGVGLWVIIDLFSLFFLFLICLCFYMDPRGLS
jgi:hypothetical protein